MKDKELESFLIWEEKYLGFGYGSGEMPIIIAIREFLDSLKENGQYDFETLENLLGKSTAWLLINLFCKSDIVEYGTSTRYGWITEKGNSMRRVFSMYSDDEIYKELDEYEETFDS